MILHELVGGEHHPTYQQLEIENGARQYDFLRSIVNTSLAVNRAFLSSAILKALNFHAIACLHTSAGEYRPGQVIIQSGDPSIADYHPPQFYLVRDLVDDMINTVNRGWDAFDSVELAAFVLWRLNCIHPFINGNGRTARAACYFLLCVKAGGWLPGTNILPALLKRDRVQYIDALRQVDESAAKGALDLGPLHALLDKLLAEQLGVGGAPAAAAAPSSPGPGPAPAGP